ncbi:LamB/YcsF family protein, partial [Oceanospirillum sp. HFRX-1_2]
GICQAAGEQVSYVEPHGALYNDMMQQPQVLRAILQAVVDFSAGQNLNLPVLIMATADNSEQQRLADELGASLMFEAFADRAYDENGMLVNRRLEGAVYHDQQQVVDQALAIAKGELIKTFAGGIEVSLNADTLCVHGDNEASLQAVKAIRQALNAL